MSIEEINRIKEGFTQLSNLSKFQKTEVIAGGIKFYYPLIGIYHIKELINFMDNQFPLTYYIGTDYDEKEELVYIRITD